MQEAQEMHSSSQERPVHLLQHLGVTFLTTHNANRGSSMTNKNGTNDVLTDLFSAINARVSDS
jgi:hypothetical protein